MRKRHALTLEEVSKRSGLSISVLSKLERNQSRAELDTLYRIAKVFGLSASDLLSLSESHTASTAESTEYDSGPFHFSRIDFKGIQCYQASARSGEELSNPEAHGHDWEICWVRTGEMRIHLPGEQHLLRAGEAVQFDAALEHRYEIVNDSELFIVHLEKPHRF
jgi:transcriptional regulator with XRE-family HTH domain